MPYPRRWRPTLRLIERPVRLAQTMVPGIPYANLFDSMRFADMARLLLGDADVLYERHTFMCCGGAILSTMLSAPLLLEVNGHHFDELAIQGQHLSQQQRVIARAITRWVVSAADAVLFSGYGWMRRYRETRLLSHSRAHVVWPGADLDLLGHRVDPARFRRQWNLGDASIIAFAGGFYPWQGLEKALVAYERATRDRPEVRFVLAGDGPLRGEVEAQVHALGCGSRVVLVGLLCQADVASLLAAADIGLLTIENHAEFVGMKLFDYMRSGLPSIVTAPGRAHDLIRDGETGLVVEPGDVDGIASAMTRLLDDDGLRRELGRQSREEVVAKHTWGHRTAQIEKIAEKCMGESRG